MACQVVLEVNVYNAKPLGEAIPPLKVIQQGPCIVVLDINAILCLCQAQVVEISPADS